MTIDEQVELKRILTALNGLIKQLMPEDDLVRLALDPKRQAAAARMVGTTTIAQDLIDRALELCELMPHPNGLPKNGKKTKIRGGRAVSYILKRLDRASEPLPRNEIAKGAVQAGHATIATTVYGTINRLIEDGRIKLNDTNNTLELVRQ